MLRYGVAFLLIVNFLPRVACAEQFTLADEDIQKQMQISALKREISDLELELDTCKRNNKNWRTATWIGAAGTAITGVAAIAQGVKLNKLKNENKGQGTAEDKKSDEN